MTSAALVILLAALAQPEPAKPASPKPPAPEPTLDELLNLPAAPKPLAPAGPTTPAPSPVQPIDPSKAELERQLSAGEVKQLFDQAVDEMSETATRLSDARDTGLDTQRLQESTIRKLETLIDQAKKQQQKQSKSKKQQQKQQQQQQQQQQQSSQKNAQNAQANDSSNRASGPPRTDGALGVAPGGTAAWGSLPAHVRDALAQGKDDRYSSLYKALTEKYYKRLAEEPKPGETPSR